MTNIYTNIVALVRLHLVHAAELRLIRWLYLLLVTLIIPFVKYYRNLRRYYKPIVRLIGLLMLSR